MTQTALPIYSHRLEQPTYYNNFEFFTFDLGSSILVLQSNWVKMVRDEGDKIILFKSSGERYVLKSTFDVVKKTLLKNADFLLTTEHVIINKRYIRSLLRKE